MKSIVKSKRQVPYKQKRGGDLSGLGFLVGGGLGTSIEVGKCGKCGDHSPHDKD